MQLPFVLYGLAFMLMSATLLGLHRHVRRIDLDPPLSAVDRAVADAEVQAWGILGGVGAAARRAGVGFLYEIRLRDQSSADPLELRRRNPLILKALHFLARSLLFSFGKNERPAGG